MNSTSPLVSAIMPAYNAAAYIEAAIESVLRQTYTNIELIIINDGSTDATEAIAKKYESPPKVQIHTTDNRGQSAANNTGFDLSNGEYVKFFDADDILSENLIQLQVDRLINNPGCIASGEVWRFWKDPAQDPLYEPLANWKDLEPLEWLIIDNGKGLGMMQAGLFLFPSELVKKAGGWDPKLSLINDMDFCSRVLLSSQKVLYCEGARLYYRSGLQNNLSSQYKLHHLISSYTSLEKTTNNLLARDNSQEVSQVLARYWKMWSVKYYPFAPELYRKAEEWIKRLGGSQHIPFGGLSQKLSRILGWKAVKWMHIIKDRISL